VTHGPPSIPKLALLQPHLDLYEAIFTHFGAADNPLMCITPVVDDKHRVETVSQL
jgi:hypothetical protein